MDDFFFFQAEDGIRDGHVTGVQTCALPIWEVTRTRIQLEAERIGYVPNPHARSLVLGSRMLIGMVISNPSNPFYAGLISEIEKHAGEEDYSIILFSSDESSEQEDEAAQAMLRAGVDGAIRSEERRVGK